MSDLGSVVERVEGQHSSHQVPPMYATQTVPRGQRAKNASSGFGLPLLKDLSCMAGNAHIPRLNVHRQDCGPEGISCLCVNRKVSGQARGQAQSGGTWMEQRRVHTGQVTAAAAEGNAEAQRA